MRILFNSANVYSILNISVLMECKKAVKRCFAAINNF
jgi:hypothetical protein